MGGLLGKSKNSRPEEVWRQESQFENRLAQQKHPDTWGGVTSYNLLDIQDVKHVSNQTEGEKYFLTLTCHGPTLSLTLSGYWNSSIFNVDE